MVIQRWQSVLLLVSAIMMGFFSFVSLGQIQTTDYSFNLTALGIDYEGVPAPESGMLVSTWYLFILALSTCVVYIIDVFLYKNLNLQKKACAVAILMTIATMASVIAVGYNVVEGGEIGWSSAALSPVIAVFFAVMAWRRIQKDDKLLKSVDRLR